MKSDSEKGLDALRSISKMLEILDQFEKKWEVENSKFEPNDDKFRKYYYSQQRTWLNHIKSNLT